MDNNKKQQNFSRSGNTKTSNSTTDLNRQKPISESQSKHWPNNSRRREKPQSLTRSNNDNSVKQQQQQTSSKLRQNVDKRPRARGYYGNNNNGGSFNENAAASTRLASEDSSSYAYSGEEGAVGRFESNKHDYYELNSPGIRKQNLNHLLNFFYTPREVDYFDGAGVSGGSNHMNTHGHRMGYVKRHRYNKEQFLQANFQFVIKASAKRKTDDSPDTLIDWSLIEQINIQTLEEPQCPICLYPPVAAKVTRCGHVYCWPCVLHYLSLSDKTWRKCPICYDALHVGDLKSATIVQQQTYNVGASIEFKLMRRTKGSLLIEKYDSLNNEKTNEKYPYVSSPKEEKLFSKFILATRNDVADILARERYELLKDVDESCPEYVFIQQALLSLADRSSKLGEVEVKETPKQCQNEESSTVFAHANNEDAEQPCEASGISTVVEETTTEAIEVCIQPIDNEISLVPSGQQISSTTSKFYYFYQAVDGQNIYLHPLNVKMLQACYGSLADGPPSIKSRILQKEQHSMDEDLRRKFTCLGHLPLTCQFSVVEVELLPPYVTEDVIEVFMKDIIHRKRERQRRAREEREREKHIDAINARQMGKLIATTANINISSSHEFPTCGFDELIGSAASATNAMPTCSKGSRKKTTSTSSAGSSSYSSIAINCQQEHSPWTILNAKSQTQRSPMDVEDLIADENEVSVLSSIQTNLGDVLAQALAQKNHKKLEKAVNAGDGNVNTNKNKKSKKSKKMLPLYSTGMNFGGN